MTLFRQADYWIAKFTAMGCPCEILIDEVDNNTVRQIADLAKSEAYRIENKFSRYKKHNIIDQINSSQGHPVNIDDETKKLLQYAHHCYQLSEGKFDISSGVLRQIWSFDGSDRIPSQSQIEQILPNVGWQRITLTDNQVIVPTGMEIDLGGIGKEYAVDKIALMINHRFKTSVTVNFGGDLCVTSCRNNGHYWRIGIDDPTSPTTKNMVTIKLAKGGIATSGDAKRYLIKDGIRYSHILDPQTGWPVKHAPHSVTVLANTCTEAGMLATFAMLQGDQAREFLDGQDIQYWCF